MTLELDQVTMRYGAHIALREVRLKIRPGEVSAILGPNGSGKSTCLKALSGELRPGNGRVLLDGVDLAGLAPETLAARRAVMPQRDELAFAFRVEEVIGLGLFGRSQLCGNGREAVLDAARRADVADYLDRNVLTLSGGERQRVAFARALVQLEAARRTPGKAAYLLLDEPTSSLDLAHVAILLHEARRLADDGVGVACVLHDLTLAARFADRAALFRRGELIAHAPVRDALTEAKLTTLYDIPVRAGALAGEAVIYPSHLRGGGTLARAAE